MDSLSLLQWPAMVINILSAWLLTSRSKGKRHAGFLFSLVSNALWISWGWYEEAFAVLGLQLALAYLNIQGARKTETGVERS